VFSMRSLQMIAASVLIASIAWTAGPQTPPSRQRPPVAKPAAHAAAKPPISDARLEAIIRAKFAKSKINADKFTVHVQGGVATIEGKTDVIQHKGTATRMARTAGAAAINNHVQISDAAKEKAAGNLEKGRRRAQVKRGDVRSDARPPK
jgi:hypothetical protein